MSRRKKKRGSRWTKPSELVIKDGHKLAVLRPKDAKLALASLKAFRLDEPNLPPKERSLRFNSILRQQPYTFVGLVRKDQKIVSPETGEVLGKIEPGDSFVPWEELVRHVQREQREREAAEAQEPPADPTPPLDGGLGGG